MEAELGAVAVHEMGQDVLPRDTPRLSAARSVTASERRSKISSAPSTSSTSPVPTISRSRTGTRSASRPKARKAIGSHDSSGDGSSG